MTLLFFAIIVAFCSTFYAIPIIIQVARTKKLYDEPDEVRKLHKTPIPSLGGLGIFVGFSLAVLLSINFIAAGEFQYYIGASLVIFFVGLKDDILVLEPMKKLGGQLVATAILIFGAHLSITNMHGFLGVHQLNTYLSIMLTFFTVIVTINAFNLIDGVDGLAGTISLIACLVFGTFFLLNGTTSYAILAFSFAASVFAFLLYNFQPAKIFMGDTGSLMCGLVNSILVIKFIQSGSTFSNFPVAATPGVGFSILLLPLMDTLRVFGYRMLRGRSPFSADRNHIHHLLLDLGMKHRQVVYCCAAIAIVFFMAGFLLQNLGTTALILSLVAAFYAGIFSLYAARNKKRRVLKEDAGHELARENLNPGVVPLFPKVPKAGTLKD
jgi:UDP-GlcNAc:undecaprenyl-phosphate GlcNAc-1-phosphate transferase